MVIERGVRRESVAASSAPRPLCEPTRSRVSCRRLAFGVAWVCAIVAALAFSSTAVAATAWSGSGTGTTNVVSDGTSAAPEFTYSWSDPCSCGTSGNWAFSTTSDVSGTVTLDWTYTGFNAWFAVTAGLNAFVTHLGTTTTTQLVNAGPVNCCSSPSGGFSYSGSTALTVAVGDSYGFQMSGSNGDSDSVLNGTLTVNVTEPDPPVASVAQRAGYCAVPGDVDPATSQPIPAGTFLNLVVGQPASDPDYAGATAANYVQGEGITCDSPPAADSQQGYQGAYPYFAPPPLPARTGYCTVASDFDPLTGQPYAPGVFVDLLTNQPESDPSYAGAIPAIFVQGQGVACEPVPTGYVQHGYVGLNPYYEPVASA